MKQESKDEFYEIISTEYLFILTDAIRAIARTLLKEDPLVPRGLMNILTRAQSKKIIPLDLNCTKND